MVKVHAALRAGAFFGNGESMKEGSLYKLKLREKSKSRT